MKAASRIVLGLSRKLVGSSAAGGRHFDPSRPATRRTVLCTAVTILGVAVSFCATAFPFAVTVRPVERDHDDRLVTMIAANRPFPVVEIQIGDVPVAIPKDWADAKLLRIHRGDRPFITFAGLNLPSFPRTPHFEMPPLSFFTLVEPAAGLAAKNIERRKAEIASRAAESPSDEDGFWHWKTREHLLVKAVHKRPFDQPLVVQCGPSIRPSRKKDEQSCTVGVYWTLNTGVRYDFYDTDVPKPRWVELDRRVLEFLRFLDGREPLADRN